VVVSSAWWTGHDVSFLTEDAHVRRGEWWRFLTSAFPHVNAIHLAFNVYWVWVLGTLVETVFGHLPAAAIFVLFAVVSGAAEYALFDGGVGLSGVGYGLVALLWVLGRRDGRFAGAVDSTTIGLFVVWFLVCIATTVQGSMPVGNVAHAAGALVGALLGVTIASRDRRRFAGVAATLVLAVAGLLGATAARPYVNRSRHPGLDEARLGYEALDAKRDEEAVRWLDEATALDPKDARSWFNLGIAYQRLGKSKDAAAAYATAYRLEPTKAIYRLAHEASR
jgi:membrane associated rhomboid family serine protease